VPPITPASSRAAKVSGYQPDTAVTTLSSAKPASTPISTGRRGKPRNRAVTGIAASAEAIANALTSKPTRASGTCRSVLIWGSSPAGSRSVTTSVKAAVVRASRPHHGNVSGSTRPC
jgi:hypothetical protein